jgi:UDP-N-acetylglucosamine acyltransferase
MIHASAIVSPNAEIGAYVTIGAYTVVADNVRIGEGTEIGPHVVIDPYTSIGENCRIFQFASIGAIPQSLKFEGEKTLLTIGRGTTIREFVTINRGTVSGGGITEVGEENFIMAYCHIAHDCITGNNVILANAATLAGHITIGNFATVGGIVAIHQFVRIGDYAFVGGASAVVKDVPPFVIAAGDRATLHSLNTVGLKRHGFTPATLSALKKAYRIIFRIGLTLNEAIERARAEVDQIPEVIQFIDFIKSSQRGVTRCGKSKD